MLTKEEVQNIALLARIGLKEEEVEQYRKDLSAVLGFFTELEVLSTDDVEPIGHITGRENVAREDRVKDFDADGKAAILRNAPDTKNGQVKVKSVF